MKRINEAAIPAESDVKKLHIIENLCDFCGTCVAVCPEDCIYLKETTIRIDFQLCTLCMNCVKVCPINIIEPLNNEESL